MNLVVRISYKQNNVSYSLLLSISSPWVEFVKRFFLPDAVTLLYLTDALDVGRLKESNTVKSTNERI